MFTADSTPTKYNDKSHPKGVYAPPPADRTDVEAPLVPPSDIAQGQLTGQSDAIVAAPSSHSKIV